MLATWAPGAQAASRARPPDKAPEPPPAQLDDTGPDAAAARVVAAERCYGQADMGCVVRTLEAVDPPATATATASDHWRLLGFAAARLDRHPLARKAFRAWIGLRPGNRLAASDTPPIVYEDYVAALLVAHSADLDLDGRLAWRPVLPAPAVTATDLPVPAPPAPAPRDRAGDIVLSIGVPVVWPLRSVDRAAYAANFGLGLALESTVTSSLRLGIDLRGLRLEPAAGQGQALLLPLGGVRATWIATGGDWGELGTSLVVGGGAAIPTSGESALLGQVAPSLRYAWPGGDRIFGRRDAAPMASFVELGYALLIATGGGTSHLALISVGLELRPGAGQSRRARRPHDAQR